MLDDIQQSYLQHLRQEEVEELTKSADIIEAFKEFTSQRGLKLIEENFKYIRTIGVVAVYPNLLSYLNPAIINDKEGLLDYKALCESFERKRFIPGYLSAENYKVMAHPYFRRGFNGVNNFAPRFVELFWAFNSPDIQTYISLDFDRVRIDTSEFEYREFDTWFGAKFDRNIEAISDGIVQLRPPLDLERRHISFIFADVYSLDIKWATKGNIKSFQLEEFKDETIKITKNDTEYYPVRYIHAEYDVSLKQFRHFDGAIHFYTEDEYFQRRDSDFNYNAKNPQIKTLSQKLFKMNGIISVDTWIDFTSHFLTSNPLVFEYFEGKYPERIQEILEKIRSMPNR